MHWNIIWVIRKLTEEGYSVVFIPSSKDSDISLRLVKVHSEQVYCEQEENILSRYTPIGRKYISDEDIISGVLSNMKLRLDRNIFDTKPTIYQEPNPDPMIIKD